MNSQDLRNYGFEKWILFSEVLMKNIPHDGGVYVLRLNRDFYRLVSKSDILYIGSTTDFNDRFIENFFRGTGGPTTQRIHNYLIKKGYVDKVMTSWIVTEDFQIEKNLLKRYEEEHHELPPWNRQV